MADVISADEIREALRKRYPLDKHLHVDEAPQFSDRGGRKIDVLVVDLWRSRGLARHAFEIKRSIADFRKEVAEPEKADWWWSHCSDFTIVAPATVCARIQANNELPPNWGLMSVSEAGRIRVLSPSAVNLEPEPIGWETAVGMMRAIVNVGPFTLQREYQRGWDAMKATLEDEGNDLQVARERRVLAERLEALQASVETFEQATGVRIATYRSDTPAQTFKAAAGVINGTTAAARRLAQVHGMLTELGSQVDAAKAILESFPGPNAEELPFDG